MSESVGSRMVALIASKDAAGLAELLHPEVDFKALTPGDLWEGSSPDDVLGAVLGNWFEPKDEIEKVARVHDGDPVVDTEHVTYRFVVVNPDGRHEVEQQAYYRLDAGKVAYLRVMCSGYRPVAG